MLFACIAACRKSGEPPDQNFPGDYHTVHFNFDVTLEKEIIDLTGIVRVSCRAKKTEQNYATPGDSLKPLILFLTLVAL